LYGAVTLLRHTCGDNLLRQAESSARTRLRRGGRRVLLRACFRPPLLLRGSRTQPSNASMDWRVSQHKFVAKKKKKQGRGTIYSRRTWASLQVAERYESKLRSNAVGMTAQHYGGGKLRGRNAEPKRGAEMPGAASRAPTAEKTMRAEMQRLPSSG
jgi:hypothetical protein